MIEFLRHATRSVEEGVGWWSTWDDPDPLAAPAKEKAMEKMPRKEHAKSVPVNIEVDQEQFSKLHLRSRTERERSRERWVDSGSDSTDTVYNRRRKVMLKRAERDNAAHKDYEREARRIEEEQEELEARREIMEEQEREIRREEDEKRKHIREICGRNILPEDREPPPPPPRYSEVQYKGDYYYNRSYAARFPRTGAGSSNDHVRQRRSY